MLGFSLGFYSDLEVMFAPSSHTSPILLFLLFTNDFFLILLPTRQDYHSNISLNLDNRFELEVCSHALKMRQVHI